MDRNFKKNLELTEQEHKNELKLQELYEELRECDICKVKMLDGYCFDAGFHYACNDEHRDIVSHKEYGRPWNDLYTDEGDFYYTTWYEEFPDEISDILFDMIDESLKK